MEVVTVLNLKGGVGKTSSTHHLSGALALGHKLRVLVVDNDPQASLTNGWWGSDATFNYDPRRTIVSILDGSMPAPEAIIHETGVPGISLVPGSFHATEYNDSRPHQLPREAWETIREFLREVEDAYDVVLIDCPPNLQGCSYAALSASDWLMIPILPEDYGAQGGGFVLDALKIVNDRGYPVQLLGLLLSMMSPRKALHQVFEKILRNTYGDYVFSATLPHLGDFSEAIASKTIVQKYKPKGAASKAAKAVADEMLQRIGQAKESKSEGQGVAA